MLEVVSQASSIRSRTMANPVADLLGLGPVLEEIAEHTRQISEHTQVLPKMDRQIRELRKDTRFLPEVSVQMEAVAEAIRVMDARMAQIEAAMPVLVEVQGHLALVPETLGQLDVSLRELLVSLEGLKGNVGTLETSLHPLARVAGRFGGRGNSGEEERKVDD